MSFRRAQTASQWKRNLYPVQSNQIKIISCIDKRKDWKWDGERGTEVLQKGSPEIAAIPGQILYKSAFPKSVGGFCSFFKNIRSDVFLFPSLFFALQHLVGVFCFPLWPQPASPGFAFIHPLPFSINWAGSVFGLAWLGSVNPSMAIQYCGVIFCHWCGFKLTLCTKWALCDPFFLTQRFSWSQ